MAAQPMLKNILYSEILQCRIFKILYLLLIAVFTIYPVLDVYSHYQIYEELDCNAGRVESASEVDTSDDGPSGSIFHINKTNTPTFGQSVSNTGREPIQNASISDAPYYRFSGSIIPINEIISHLICRPLSSDPSPPVS